MNFNPILIIGGEPKSIFLEILLKTLKKLKKGSTHNFNFIKRPIIKNMKKFNQNLIFNQLNKNFTNINSKKINLINIKYNKFSFSQKNYQ